MQILRSDMGTRDFDALVQTDLKEFSEEEQAVLQPVLMRIQEKK